MRNSHWILISGALLVDFLATSQPQQGNGLILLSFPGFIKSLLKYFRRLTVQVP